MVEPLTIVLPLYNAERQVARTVRDIFDATHSLADAVSLVLVDDGSEDETYEEACQLSKQYPRMTVLRQPVRSGLGAAVQLVRERVEADYVLMHDGVSPIRVTELTRLLRMHPNRTDDWPLRETAPHLQALRGGRRDRPSTASRAYRTSSRALTKGFRWISLSAPAPSRVIPPLGGPNFVGISPSITAGG